MREAPIGIRLLPKCRVRDRTFSYKVFIIIFTFFCYTSYHLSRKPISVVKSVLHRNCSINYDGTITSGGHSNSTTWCDWKPFDGTDSAGLFGFLDLAFIFAYASGSFVSGHIAERMNLRYFMSTGQVLTGFFTMLFGFGYFFEVHSLTFFMIVQILAGIFQSTGWTSVVTCMGNWYGKGKRGFIMGVWNAHTSVGNILGLFLAGAFVDYEWGLSFIVPGVVIFVNGVLTFLFLVPEPTDVGCEPPDQIGRKRSSPSESSVCEKGKAGSTAIAMEVYTVSSDKKEKTATEKEKRSVPTLHENIKSMTSLPKEKPVSFIGALKIPGVVEFSMCLFFSKLVSYTFLFWLPKYISSITTYSPSKSAFISVLFDVGGIFGGITSGIISDVTGMSALTCFGSLLLTGPILHIYKVFGHQNLAASIGLSFLSGFFVNGPYALITTAVSADLGTQQALKDNTKALATVSAIIDGTGSIGAAIGPLLAGVIVESYGWSNVFYVLIGSIICAMLFLLRLLIKEIKDSDLLNTIRTRFSSKESCDMDTHL